MLEQKLEKKKNNVRWGNLKISTIDRDMAGLRKVGTKTPHLYLQYVLIPSPHINLCRVKTRYANRNGIWSHAQY